MKIFWNLEQNPFIKLKNGHTKKLEEEIQKILQKIKVNLTS